MEDVELGKRLAFGNEVLFKDWGIFKLCMVEISGPFGAKKALKIVEYGKDFGWDWGGGTERPRRNCTY
jgi:hypothetical protein